MNWRNLLVLIAGHVALGSTLPMMVLLNGFVGVELAPSEVWATLGMGTLVVGTALSTVFAARLAHFKGRRFGFLVAAGFCLLGAGFCILSIKLSSFWLYCVATSLFGVMAAFVQQFRFAAAENADPDKVSFAVSLIFFAGIGAAVLGPQLVVFAQLTQPDSPYVSAYVLLSGLAIVAAIVLSFYGAGEAVIYHEKRKQWPFRHFLKREYWLGVSCGACAFSVMSLVMTATPISMHFHDGLSVAETAQVIQAHIIAMFIPSLFTGYIIRVLGVYWVMLIGVAFNGACVFAALAGVGFGDYLVALICLGLGWNAMFMAGTQLVATTYLEDDRFQAQAYNDFTVFSGQAIASLGAGFLLAQAGWVGLNWVAAGILCGFLAFLLMVMFTRRD